MYLKESAIISGKEISIETGRFAKQADGSVLVRCGDTMVLATAVSADEPREGADFVPLTVDYVEKAYSAGYIPGGYFRREGKPTEAETLTSRLIDRSIRPLFPKGFMNETHVVAIVLSADKENDPSILAIIGASAALHISSIPFGGPVAAVKVGRINGDFVINPVHSMQANSNLDLVMVSGSEGIVMVEGEANFIKEDDLINGLMFGDETVKPLIELQKNLRGKAGKAKKEFIKPVLSDELVQKIADISFEDLKKALDVKGKLNRADAVNRVFENLMLKLGDEYAERKTEVKGGFEELLRQHVRRMVVEQGKRIDGRKADEIREIECSVGILPRVHGSALFSRGETQALVSVTLGTTQDEQRIELLTGETTKSFMLHYNFPPFSVGEAKPLRSPSRREIGHAHLAERAVTPVLPAKDINFPYTIRIVSEILESNGSSSMATVCGSSLAMMDAGIPVKGDVAGIATGLIKEGDKIVILTDIMGDEDHLGDMDFKIAGNENGINALQMDIKCSGLNREIMEKVLQRSREARLRVLDEMRKAISEARKELSHYAPRIYTLFINSDRVKDLIGPGGKNIKAIIQKTNTQIDIDNDGKVSITATDEKSAEEAIMLVKSYTEPPEVGKVYLGSVVKTVEFGAFIRIMPGVEGLCHISELSDKRVRSVEDVVREGDQVLVRVIEIDRFGKIRLSRKNALGEKHG